MDNGGRRGRGDTTGETRDASGVRGIIRTLARARVRNSSGNSDAAADSAARCPRHGHYYCRWIDMDGARLGLRGLAAVHVGRVHALLRGGRLRRSDRRSAPGAGWAGIYWSTRSAGTSACGVLARTLSPSRRHYPPISIPSLFHPPRPCDTTHMYMYYYLL